MSPDLTPTPAGIDQGNKDDAKEVKLPYNPIDSAMKTPEHARRTIQGILESYNSNYDAIAEAVQNSVDALEDAALAKLPGPYLLEVTIDLLANTMSVLDTGIGMTQEQVCEAFAPSATYKDLPTVVKKRGDKHPYRGYKGVGLTFLAYGTDDVQIQSRQNGSMVKARMRFGRTWVTGKQSHPPVLDIDSESTPLEKHRRGTNLKLQFSSETRPESLARLGSSIEVWEAIIRTRTAAGQIFIDEEPAAKFKVTLKLITKDGPIEKEIEPEFYYPHLAQRQPVFRFLDVGAFYDTHPGVADIPEDYKRQDGVYVKWDTPKIKENLEKGELKDFEKEIADFSPRLYAFRPYYAPLWTAINEAATKQVRAHYFGGGLVIGLDHQRIADNIRIQVSRSDFTGQQVFVLVHFEKARPDQGRKTLQTHVMELAQLAADDAVQYLLKQTSLLKPAGEKTTAAQRAVEKNHEDWVDNVKEHAKSNPLSVPPVSYVSTPITEQDVVGIFNQFSALDLFPGLRIFATSGQHTYDCYVQFESKDGMERLRYRSIDDNPLGLSNDVLSPDDKSFSTKSLTLEFKNNLEGLLADLESENSKKSFAHIDICVCWGPLDEQHRAYAVTSITETNLHERRFPGVTHVLRKDGEAHVIQVIMLEDVAKRIAAGQIRLPRPD
jgi:hypothetical protein